MTDAGFRKVGEIRPSHLIFGFGVGSLVDLPNFSAVVSGLDHWDVTGARTIYEPRLLQAVRATLGRQVSDLIHPPVIASDGATAMRQPAEYHSNQGVPVATFPRWMVCPACKVLGPVEQFKCVIDSYAATKSQYLHENCQSSKRAQVVFPVRFLVACPAGHLDDFPWHRFVHRGQSNCTGELSFEEFSVTSEARDIFVKCRGCDVTARPMLEAFGEKGRDFLDKCTGRHPHLRSYDSTACTEQPKAILLGASNLWFPASVNVLHVPRSRDEEENQVAEVAGHLKNVSSYAELVNAVNGLNAAKSAGVSLDARLCDTLERIPLKKIWNVLEQIKAEESDAPESIELKPVEYNTFCRPAEAPRNHDFSINEVQAGKGSGLPTAIARVIRVDRLREVRALTGFSRLEAPGELSEINPGEKRSYVPLSRANATWVPAVEVRGEGVFIQFSEASIAAWLARPGVKERETMLLASHTKWRKERDIENPEAGFPGMRFVLIHSISHALMRQISLACGYASASLRERIYSANAVENQPAMAGLLLYTSAPDSEGTLGGLVRAAETKELRRHLELAIEEATLCGSDPLCAEHDPTHDSSLHGAACHCCLLAPETSCEFNNRYLDRALIAPTLSAVRDLAFFGVG
jgi:hypothetical protein